MADFILFGTQGCHLCEEAWQLLADAGIEFQFSDIMDNEEWQAKYGLLIPVLWHDESRCQLDWPFDKMQLQNFYQTVNSNI